MTMVPMWSFMDLLFWDHILDPWFGVQILVPYRDHRMCGPLRTLIGPWSCFTLGPNIWHKKCLVLAQLSCSSISYLSILALSTVSTVGENIIATIKMWNNFCYPLKMVYCTFLYCSLFSYRSSNFAIAKVVALNHFASIFVWVL